MLLLFFGGSAAPTPARIPRKIVASVGDYGAEPGAPTRIVVSIVPEAVSPLATRIEEV